MEIPRYWAEHREQRVLSGRGHARSALARLFQNPTALVIE